MIRFSAVLVAVAIGVLIGGVATSKLLLVYVAIAVSAAALVALAIGVVLKRAELFGEGQLPARADAGAAPGQPVLSGQNSTAVIPNGSVASPQASPFPATAGTASGQQDAGRGDASRGDAAGGRGAFGYPPAAAAAATQQSVPGVQRPLPAKSAAPWNVEPSNQPPREAAAPWGTPREAQAPWDKPRESEPAWGTAAQPPRDAQPSWNDPQPSWNSPSPRYADQRDARPAEDRPAASWPGRPDARPPLSGRHSRSVGADAPLGGFATPAAPAAPTAPAPGFTRPGPGSPGPGSTAMPSAFPWDDRPKPSFQPASPSSDAAPVPGGTGGPGRNWFDRPATQDQDAAGRDEATAKAEKSAAESKGEKTKAEKSKAEAAWVTTGDVGVKAHPAKAGEDTVAAAKAGDADSGTSSASDTADSDEDWRTRYSWLIDSDDDDTEPASDESSPEPAADASPSATTVAGGEEPRAMAADEPAAAAVGEPGDLADATPAPVIDDEPAGTAEPEAGTAKPEATAPKAVTERDAVTGTGPSGDDAEGESPVVTPAGEKLVTVVPGVPRFHDANCILIRFMGDSDTQRMTIPEAEKSGCTPCAACNPE